MMKFYLAVVLSLLTHYFVLSVQEVGTRKSYVKICTLNHNVTALRIFDNQLLAGTANALYSYGLDMVLKEKIDLPSPNDTVQSCMDELFPTCENYIKVILPIPNSDKLLACGTNAYSPKCSLHYKDQLENFTVNADSSVQNTGYSPEGDVPIFALVASNQRFFSATAFTRRSIDMGMSPNPLQSDRKANITVTAIADNNLLDLTATFKAIHEYGDYIYFFLTESASTFELGSSVAADAAARPLYSKVIRICKSDNGINNGKNFSTFQKARILCNNSVGNSATFVYNEIASTFMGSENGEQVLYATFNAPRNGPTGGAICKYSFSSAATGSLSSVFEDGQYYVLDSSTKAWGKADGPTVNCMNHTRSGERYKFAFNTVNAIQDSSNSVRPLVKVDGELLGKIAAEVITYNGNRQEVIYYSNQLGQIKQVVVTSENTYTHSLLDDVDMSNNDRYEVVQSILLQEKPDHSGSTLYINRGKRIIQIERGNCQQHTSCQECLESRDPYCGWSHSAPSCVNKIKNVNLELVQSFSTTASDLANECGVIVQPIPTSTLGVTYSEIPSNSDADRATDSLHSTKSLPSSEPLINESVGINIPAIVGAAIGTFILGLFLGLIISFVFLVRIQMRKRHTYQVHDKSKSNNMHQNGTVPETIVDINAVNATETKEVYRPNNNTTAAPRYVEHALPQHVQPQLPDTDVKTNIIEVDNTVTQSNVMDASPVKVGNGHILGFRSATSNQPAPAMADPTNSNDVAMINEVHSTPSMPATPKAAEISQNSRVGRPAPVPPVRFAVGSSNTLPHNRKSSKTEGSKFSFATDNDDAFAETDVVPPLVNVNTTRFNSLGRNKSGGTSGIARRQVPNYKVPKGRTDSTTWLRQESVSSDVSPLQSPISDV